MKKLLSIPNEFYNKYLPLYDQSKKDFFALPKDIYVSLCEKYGAPLSTISGLEIECFEAKKGTDTMIITAKKKKVDTKNLLFIAKANTNIRLPYTMKEDLARKVPIMEVESYSLIDGW